MASKIFISYSRKDQEVVLKLRDEIHRRTGVLPWMDVTGIETGTQFADVIARNIEGCDLLVFVMSRNSAESSWTRKEVLYALNHGKKVYPVVIDDAQLPRELELLFADVDYVDVRDNVQREKLFSDLVSFCDSHGSRGGFFVGGKGDEMLATQIVRSTGVRTVFVGAHCAAGFRVAVVCAIFALGCVLGGIVWYGKGLRHKTVDEQHIGSIGNQHKTEGTVISESEKKNTVSVADGDSAISLGTGLIIQKGRILKGKEAEEAKRQLEQTVRAWENSGKICADLNLEAISLRRKLWPFVQTGALPTNDLAWVSACKRADGYLEWAFKHGKTPDAQIKERTAIRDGFLGILQRLEGELKKQVASMHDGGMEGGTFVKRTISRAALELAFLSEDDRAAAIVDFHRSITMTTRAWYANEANLVHDEIIDRIGREYDIAIAEGNKLFNAGMHCPDEISSSRPDLVMQFYDIRCRALKDIEDLVAQGHTEKALLYYSSAKKAFEVLHLEALKRPDFSSVKSRGK